MEPILGQASFFLLCLQFARNQMINLNWRPYTDAVKGLRARRLINKYKQYHPLILERYSVTDEWYFSSHLSKKYFSKAFSK
mmetsp:Transcript_62481/g.167580  ORF Transcript_62481/g.167580 Transcript_62481/m.167580 type:complete len:81 (+) Transcript_62481:642-884(+)